jgi:excisionase family DNA binding protein
MATKAGVSSPASEEVRAASPVTPPALTVNTLLSVRETMALMHCKRSYVFKLIHSGKLSYARLGGQFVVKRAEVEAFLEQSWRRNGEVKVSESKIRAVNA